MDAAALGIVSQAAEGARLYPFIVTAACSGGFLLVNSVYQIPYRSRFLRPVLSGWALSGIATARSGRPVNITFTRAAADIPGGYNLTQRPDLVPGVSLIPPGGQSSGHWF